MEKSWGNNKKTRKLEIGIWEKYKNKVIPRDIAVSLVIKFLLKEGILIRFLDAIKVIKPYKKGNDDPKFVISYATTLCINYGTLSDIFLLPTHGYSYLEGDEYQWAKGENVAFWHKINGKWQKLIGDNARLASL